MKRNGCIGGCVGTGKVGRAARWLGAIAAIFVAGVVVADPLSPALLEALEAVRMEHASVWQKAMLFANNDAINRARLGGFITDAHYQAAQREYSLLNETFAREAAEEAGADLTPQKRKGAGFNPGTDSDYILETTSKDPVGQIQDVQRRYNAKVNDHLRLAAKDADITLRLDRDDWHKRLDIDFMADPRYVSEEQFRRIAELNNDAYRRRRAAEFERLSRMDNPPVISQDLFREYAQEMQEFSGKKKKLLDELRRHPQRLSDANLRAEYHRLMAQREKYIERIEAANTFLRRQEGLPVPELGEEYWEMRYDSRGRAEFIHRSPETIAARGARRGPEGFRTTAAADALSDHSLQRAVSDLSESMAEAVVKNPSRWKGAATDIAEIADALPPAEKGRLIEKARLRAGDDFARELAEQMRKKPNGAAAAGPIASALRVSDDVRDMSQLRRSFSQAADQARRALDRIGGAEGALEIAMAINDARNYFNAVENAMDPSIPDEDADRFFEEAQETARSMALGGAMGALFERVPAVGAAYMSWTVGYTGTRFLLTNTETGRQIDRHVFEYFDRHTQAAESVMEDLTERLGGESRRMAHEDELRGLEERYTRALAEGRVRVKDGFTGADVLQAIRRGDLLALDDLLVSTARGGADKGLGETYLAWLTDTGDCGVSKRVWISAGTAEAFLAPTPCRNVLWGGRSPKPVVKTELFGGRTFESFDKVVEAVLAEIGDSIVFKRAPLAIPKTYYMAGDKHVGFEIVNHASFAPVKQAAEARAEAPVAENGNDADADERPPRFVGAGSGGGARAGDGRLNHDSGPGDDETPRFVMESDLDDADPLAGPAPWESPVVQRRIDEWLNMSRPKMPPSMKKEDRRRWKWSEWGQPYAPPAVMLTGKPDSHGKGRHQYLYEMADRLASDRHGSLRQYIETGVAPIVSAEGKGVLVRAGSVTVGAEVGMIAPPFAAKTPLGEPWVLEDHRGKMVVLVTFHPLMPQRGAEVQRLGRSFPRSAAELVHVIVDDPPWSVAEIPASDRLLPQGDTFVNAYRPAEHMSIWVINEKGEVVFRGDHDSGPSPWKAWLPGLSKAAPKIPWDFMMAADRKK